MYLTFSPVHVSVAHLVLFGVQADTFSRSKDWYCNMCTTSTVSSDYCCLCCGGFFDCTCI